MSNAILSRHRDVKPINDVATVEKLLGILVEVPVAEQQRIWIKSNDVGYVCVFEHESVPGKVIEYVQGSQQDSVTTLYEGCAKFANLEALAQVRKDLINEIGAVLMRLPSTIGVYDGGREREVSLKELGTAQLMDTLAHFTGADVRAI